MASISRDLKFFKENVGREFASDVAMGIIDNFCLQWWSDQDSTADLLAVSASLRDLEQGENGRTFAEFATEFAKLNGIEK